MTSGDLAALGIENIQGDVLVTSSGLKKLNIDFAIKDKPMLGFALTAFFSFKVKSL